MRVLGALGTERGVDTIKIHSIHVGKFSKIKKMFSFPEQKELVLYCFEKRPQPLS